MAVDHNNIDKTLNLGRHPFVLRRRWFVPWWSIPCCASPGVTQDPNSDMAVSLTLAVRETVG